MVGCFVLQLFIAGISFLASCVFNDSKYSIAVGGGIPALMYVLQMLANTGGNAEKVKYFTFFTLFDPDALIAGDRSGLIGIFVLLIGACILFVASGMVFCKKIFIFSEQAKNNHSNPVFGVIVCFTLVQPLPV